MVYEEQRQRGFTEDLYCPPLNVSANSAVFDSVCFSHAHILSLSLHTYISGNKRKRRKADCIFIHQRFYLSLRSNIITQANAANKRKIYKTQLDGEGDPLGIVQKNWNLTILLNVICTNQNPFWRIEMHKVHWHFAIQTDHLIPDRRSDLVIVDKKRESTE